jgi:hypothetical protein
VTEPTIRVIAERTYGVPQELLPDRPRDIRKMDVPEHMAERIAGWFEASGWKVTKEKIG